MGIHLILMLCSSASKPAYLIFSISLRVHGPNSDAHSGLTLADVRSWFPDVQLLVIARFLLWIWFYRRTLSKFTLKIHFWRRAVSSSYAVSKACFCWELNVMFSVPNWQANSARYPRTGFYIKRRTVICIYVIGRPETMSRWVMWSILS